MRRVIVLMVGLAGMFSAGCEKSSPTTERRLDRRLEKTKNSEEQIRLLKEAQMQFGGKEGKP